MPLLVPSAAGLANRGERQIDAVHVFGPLDQGEIGHGNPRLTHYGVGQSLVQRKRENQGIGKRVRDVVNVENRWRLRLAREAVQPLADVEDQVPAVALREPGDQPLGVADPIGQIAQFIERCFYGLDRVQPVELGCFFFGIAFGEVLVAEVVS